MLSLVTIPLRDTVSLDCLHSSIGTSLALLTPASKFVGRLLSSLVRLKSWLDANRPDLQYSPAPHKSPLPSFRRPQLILQDVCCTHARL